MSCGVNRDGQPSVKKSMDPYGRKCETKPTRFPKPARRQRPFSDPGHVKQNDSDDHYLKVLRCQWKELNEFKHQLLHRDSILDDEENSVPEPLKRGLESLISMGFAQMGIFRCEIKIREAIIGNISDNSPCEPGASDRIQELRKQIKELELKSRFIAATYFIPLSEGATEDRPESKKLLEDLTARYPYILP